MTEIFVTCGKCIPEKIRNIIGERTLPFSQGQTTIWTCMHVKTYKATYPAKYVELKK